MIGPRIPDTVDCRDALGRLLPWVSHDAGCGYGPSKYRQADGCDCGLTELLTNLGLTEALAQRGGGGSKEER